MSEDAMKKHTHPHQEVLAPEPAEVTAVAQPMPVATPVAIPVKRDWSNLYTPIAIVIAGIFVAGGLMIGLSHGGTGTTAGTAPAGAQAAAPSVNIKDVKTDGEPYIGMRMRRS